MMSSSLLILSGLVILSSLSLVSASWSDSFSGFFPEFNSGYQHILKNECARNYTEYLKNRDDISKTDLKLQMFGVRGLTSDVIECLLEATPEFFKAKMASAQVVLGYIRFQVKTARCQANVCVHSLTPSIVAILGASSQETAILSVIGQRSLLAGLLAAASPAVFASRSFEYVRSLEDLHKHNFPKPAFFTRLDPLILVLEYLLAAASLGNIVELCYRLGAQALTIVTPRLKWTFLLWAFLGFVIHGLGALALYIRTEVTKAPRAQFKPMVRQSHRRVVILEENLLFFVIYWFTNALTVCHIIYGTILFSGVLFVSIDDSIVIVVRLMASVMMCRFILTYELVNLRRIVDGIDIKTSIENANTITSDKDVEMRPP